MNRQFWLFFIILALACFKGYSQLSDLHYLPPLKQARNNASVREQAIYLSTPEVTAFTVNAYRGTATTPLATFTLSNGSPITYNLGNGDNGITMLQNNDTGVVISTGGLRFESPGGQRFYVNYRGSSNAQSTSLTSKGRQAMGTRFKWGGVPNVATSNDIAASLGIMATEDNTVVDITGYNIDCVFRLQNNAGGLTNNSIQVTLNRGQSFVLEANNDESPANAVGWLGASIQSDRPIVISNGGLNYGAATSCLGCRDAGIDQPVPEENLGKDYIFIRAGGQDSTEFPIIIATQNNTQIFVNGATTPMATINNGEYFIVPGTNYSGASPGSNMYVRTSKDAYAYQNLAGSQAVQTVGLNFVAPLNCLIPDTVNNIPDITDAAGETLTGGITIIASTTTPDANIIVTDGSGIITKPASVAVAGNPDWKTFYIPNLIGNVDVQSTGPVAVGFFGVNDNRGIAGYFSGFDVAPNVDLQITGTQCLPGANLVVVGEVFDAYQWFFDGNPIAGATSDTYNPTVAGDYFVRVTKGPCTYDSNNLQAYYCNPDIQLIKTANASTLDEGDTVTFTVTAQNFGVDPATNLIINESLPPGLTLVSAIPSIGSWSAPDWNIGTLNSGVLATLTVTATADELTNIPVRRLINTVFNTQDQIDTNITTDSPSVAMTINNDNDNDGIIDSVDIDDDNDGIPDINEGCSLGQVNYSISGGNDISIPLGSGSSGIVLDITSLDNSLNISINGTQLTSTEINFHHPLRTVEFADGTQYGAGGVSNIWSIAWNNPTNPATPLIRIRVNSDGSVELFGAKTRNGPLEPMVFVNGLTINPITWNAATNTIVLDQMLDGNTVMTGRLSSQVAVCILDTDSDGKPDGLDLDSDNDGIYDVVEAGHNTTHTNGLLVGNYGTNGLLNTLETAPDSNTINYTITNSDGTGSPDFQETDSDGDGCSDANEAYNNANADGGDGEQYGTGTPAATNPDGTVTAATYPTPADMDTNATFDFQEAGSIPTITVQPLDQRVFLGINGTVASSSDADNYQWQVSTDGGTTFNNIGDGLEYTGTQTNELTILVPDLAKNGYRYRALLTNDTFVCGQTLTNTIVLSIGPRTIITNRRITIRVNKD